MKKQVCCFILALFFSLPMILASQEIMSSSMRGSVITVGGILMVETHGFHHTEWNVHSSDIFVRLYLAEDRKIVHNTNQQYCIHYTIQCRDFNNNMSVYYDSVVVNYSPTFGYTDVSVCKYTDCIYANLSITSISGAIPDDIILELGIEVTRYSLSSDE